MRSISYVALGGSVCALVACTKVNSADLKTHGMSQQVSVTATGNGKSHVDAALFVDNNVTDRVKLSAGDTLSVKAGDQSASLQEQNVLSVLSYVADVNIDAPDTSFVISFTRANDTSAPNTNVTMPQGFTITAPAGTPSRASDDVVITYAPSGTSDKMTWAATGGDCGVPITENAIAGDPGTITIPKGSLKPDANHTTANCSITIEIRRTRTGSIDPAFGYGGNVYARQTRTTNISSAP